MREELPKSPIESLSDEELATYQWQMWTPGFGEEGQRPLRPFRQVENFASDV